MTLNERRALRYNLLVAFDRYKASVAYGTELESDERHTAILEWYYRLLDLPDDDTVYDPPEEIAYYMNFPPSAIGGVCVD